MSKSPSLDAVLTLVYTALVVYQRQGLLGDPASSIPCPCELGETKMELTFNVVIEEREGAFVATCLEMGLVATSDKREELPATMEKLVIRQVTFALENENFQDIFHPADPKVWKRLEAALMAEKAEKIRTTEEKITAGTWAPAVALKQTAYAVAS